MHVRPYQPEDAQAALDLRVVAFSTGMHVDVDATDDHYVPDERRLVAVTDDEDAGPSGRVVGQLGAWPFRQVVAGRTMPTGGVGGVTVAMDWRGRGVGSALVEAGLDLMARAGDVLSTLYPSLPGFYRAWGWELAGERLLRRIPTRDLAALAPPPSDVVVRPFDLDRDLEIVAALHDDVHGTAPGAVLGGIHWLRRHLTPDDDEPEFAFVAERAGAIVGILAGAKDGPSTDTSPFDVAVHRVAARDWDTERALWHVVARNHPVATMTTFVAAATDPVLLHLPTQVPPPTSRSHAWMTRIVDLPGAVAARGWPDDSTTLVLEVSDRRRVANDGLWRLEVADGHGAAARLEPGSDARPDARVDIGALSAITVGGATATGMARAGRLHTADAGTLRRLDRLFATPTPFVRDYF